MKNLYATSAPSKDAYEFVCIPNHKPARVKFNQYSAEVYVFCEPVVTEKGSRTQTQNFRATSKAVLREQIEAKFPNASFTTSGGTIDDAANAKAVLKSIRAQARPVTEREIQEARNRLARVYGQGAEITLEKCQKESISEAVFNALLKNAEQKFIADVTTEHRKLAAEMDETERKNLTAANVHSFVTESPWKDWFENYRQKNNGANFFGFPDYSNKNYETLISYCNARGWTIPLFGELDAAMRYLWLTAISTCSTPTPERTGMLIVLSVRSQVSLRKNANQ